MKSLLFQILLLLFSFTVLSQNIIEVFKVANDSVEVINVNLPDSSVFTIIIQDMNDGSVLEEYYDEDGEGVFYVGACNVQVSRTAFRNNEAIGSNVVYLQMTLLDVEVSVYKKKTAKIELGGDFEQANIQVYSLYTGKRHQFYLNNHYYFPVAPINKGESDLFVVGGHGVYIVTIHALWNGCQQLFTRIIYLN